MKTLLMLLSFLTSVAVYSQHSEYSFKRDYYDPEKINILNTQGVVIGYSKTDYYDKEKINIYKPTGVVVGYFKPDYWDKSKVNFHSTENYSEPIRQTSRLEVPRLTGMFQPAPIVDNSDGIDNFIKNIQAIQNLKEEGYSRTPEEESDDEKLE